MDIANLTKRRVDEKKLEKTTDKASVFLGRKKPAEISLVLVGETRMRNLNRKYRGKNRVTDVLSFEGLNEIVICLPQAVRQARAQKTSLNSELTRLLAHAIVHLRGYDHKTQKPARRMAVAEAKILAALK